MSMRIVIGWIAMLLLVGCSVGPDYERPELQAEVPESWSRETEDEPPAVPLTEALPTVDEGDHWRWWESFADTTLNGLVENALAYNNDLAAAAGRVLEARALLGGAQSAQWPKIEVGGSAARSKVSEDLTGGLGSLYGNVYGAGATLSYEVDLWGRLSRGKEAALATLVSSEQDRRAVAQGLIAEVVRTWLQIRELQMQVALTERTVANFQSNLVTVHERYRRGLVSPLDVHLASQNLAAARSAGPLYRQNLAVARRRLEILAGRYPAGNIQASDLESGDGTLAAQLMPDPLPPVPAGLPGELLERRPDLMAAELSLHSSVARIGEAKAALYPRISITGEAGSKTNELSNLFTNPTEVWSLAGNLFMPLINRGATQAQIKAAEARAQQATAQYRTTVLQAFSEVENALDQDYHQRNQETYLTDSVEQAQRSVNLAEERYRRGLDNLIITLESQRRLYNAESQLLATQRARRTARVNLIQALGGPWEELDPTTVADSGSTGTSESSDPASDQ